MRKNIAAFGSTYIETSPGHFVEKNEAVRRGLRQLAAKPTAPVKQASPTARRTPAAAASRPAPRDIPAAILAGYSNNQINALIAAGAMIRPKNPVRAADWPIGAWQEAHRRGLVW